MEIPFVDQVSAVRGRVLNPALLVCGDHDLVVVDVPCRDPEPFLVFFELRKPHVGIQIQPPETASYGDIGFAVGNLQQDIVEISILGDHVFVFDRNDEWCPGCTAAGISLNAEGQLSKEDRDICGHVDVEAVTSGQHMVLG